MVEDQEVYHHYVQGVYSLHVNAVRFAVTIRALVQLDVSTVD